MFPRAGVRRVLEKKGGGRKFEHYMVLGRLSCASWYQTLFLLPQHLQPSMRRFFALEIDMYPLRLSDNRHVAFSRNALHLGSQVHGDGIFFASLLRYSKSGHDTA
jgi:hypothetical protein